MKYATLLSLFLLIGTPMAMAAEESLGPWSTAKATLDDAIQNIPSKGLTSIAPHAQALEAAMVEGLRFYGPDARAPDGNAIELTDGIAAAALATTQAAARKQSLTVINSPYPMISLILALYYNEIKQPEKALTAIATGIQLTPPASLAAGETMPALYGEKAAAFAQMKRWADGAAACEAGLKLEPLATRHRARLQRCRGFNLIELGHLDDAQTAFVESLHLEPGNPLAQKELAYIKQLRTGGMQAPTEQLLLGSAQDAPPADAPATPPK